MGEKEELGCRVDLLKAELRRVLEENRILGDAVDQQKLRLAQTTAREATALRESALDSAKELFRSMLDGGGGGAVTGGSASAPTPPPVPPATALRGPMSGAFPELSLSPLQVVVTTASSITANRGRNGHRSRSRLAGSAAVVAAAAVAFARHCLYHSCSTGHPTVASLMSKQFGQSLLT